MGPCSLHPPPAMDVSAMSANTGPPDVNSLTSFDDSYKITLNKSFDIKSEKSDDDVSFAGMSLNVLAQVATDRLEIDGNLRRKKKVYRG